ncbi:MAG: FHA domain-containing protein [Elusimicrobiota bacterium]|nr:MAG: FHA domain-containing protein [Elusimicrobiota bacterium]
MPELSIAIPGQTPRRVPLLGPYTIGRGSASDLILKDSRVSRAHALLRPLGRGNYFLLDLGSANGTFLNGRIVTAPVQLADGDSIVIADATLKFDAPDMRPITAPADHDTTMETAVNVSTEAVSILVVDVRDFTKLSESMPPKELPGFIGAWFRDASAVIESHGGVIDKFIGDAVMAYWLGGGAAGGPNLALGPLESAVELVETARLYHGQLHARHPDLTFAVGCGIHMGEAMFGNIGSSARRDFTAIGDCVNIAFRLESLCKELQRPIVVSDEIRAAAAAAYAFEDMGMRTLKGKAADVRVFSASRNP